MRNFAVTHSVSHMMPGKVFDNNPRGKLAAMSSV